MFGIDNVTSSLPQLQNEMQTLTGEVSCLFYVQIILRPRLSHRKTHHHHALHDPHVNENKQLTHSTTHTTYARRPTSQVTAGFVGRSVRPLAGGAVWRARRDVERPPYQCTLTGVQPGWMMHCLTTSSYLSPVTSRHARGLQNMIS